MAASGHADQRRFLVSAKTPLNEMKQLHLALIAAPDFDTDGPIADGIRDRMDGLHGPYHKMSEAEHAEYGRWQCEVERYANVSAVVGAQPV